MARKNKRKRLPRVGRIVPIVGIRNHVYGELETIAQRLAPVRAMALRLYGSRAALGRSHADIRDADWMDRDGQHRGGEGLGESQPGRAAALGVAARLWKATLDDVLADSPVKPKRKSKEAPAGSPVANRNDAGVARRTVTNSARAGTATRRTTARRP